MTWIPDTKTVIYRSRRSWHTKRNFEVFKATDFLAAAIEHIPPIMKRVETIVRPGEVEFFLRLLGLWEALISLPPPPEPPFDIETFEPIEPPWQAIRAWIPADDDEAPTDTLELWDQTTGTGWKAPEIDLGDGRTLVLEYT